MIRRVLMAVLGVLVFLGVAGTVLSVPQVAGACVQGGGGIDPCDAIRK